MRGKAAKYLGHFNALLWILILALGSCPAFGAPTANRPFPQHVTYARGVILPNHLSRSAMDATVQEYYNNWQAMYVKSIPGTSPEQEFVEYASGPETVSEAQGYGMVISAYMANKIDFDAMFHYFKAHPSEISPHLMAWRQEWVNGQMVDTGGADSATDGDLDIAYALLLADKQWGSSDAINYKAEALAVMSDILAKDVNQADWNLLLGDWAFDSDMNHTRTSDFMVDHLLAFAAADPAHASQWMKVYDKICVIVNYQYKYGGSNYTGLLPDFMVKLESNFVPVSGTYLESIHDGDYYYNSCRTPWRLPMAYIVSGKSDILSVLTTQNFWIMSLTGGSQNKILAGYYVKNGPNGTSFEDYGDLCFTAPFAVLAMIDPNNQDWLNKLWTSITGGDYGTYTNYFDDTIRMQVLLVVSGNWWSPEAPPRHPINTWQYLLLGD
jgi:hypothetical protein